MTHPVSRTLPLLLPLLVLTACGSGGAASSSASATKEAGSSKPTSSSAAKLSPSSAPATSAAPTTSAPPSASAAAAEPKELSTDAFLKLLKLPVDSKPQTVPGMEGFGFLAPAGTKLTDVGAGRPKKWGTTTFGGMTMATLLVNHEQDDGEKCMKLADAKAKLGSAKILREEKFQIPVEEKDGKYTDYGDEAAELLVFERDGKQGFYAHKVFDHGDDATRICCTAGPAADAKTLAGTAEPDQIEAMSAVCLSWTFKF
jgi:hypothetical protein